MPEADEHKPSARSLAATLAFVWLGFAIYTVLQQVSGVLTLRDFRPTLFAPLLVLTLYYWLPWALFAPVVAAGSARFPIRPGNWSKALLAHALMLLTIALVHGLGIGVLYHYFEAPGTPMASYEPWQHAGHFLFGDDMLLFDAVVYAVFAATLNIRNFHQIVRQQELDASKLNQRLAELRLQTLRMQIDPHFLFNALNAIAVLVKKGDSDRAERTIVLLSEFFRRTLDSSDRHWVTLDEELTLVRQYVALVQVRLGERLAVELDCDSGLRATPVPAMLLQPLVENAVTHGFGDKVGPCALQLTCRADGGKLAIVITDDGVGGRFYADPQFEEGVGLKNVRGRLEQMYGSEQSFALTSTPGAGTRIEIRIPLRPAALRVAV
jgi:anti-sigma regulatory factor (Ser/Thr protein kinase)